MTQLEYARNSIVTRQMRKVAHWEGLDPVDIKNKVAQGVVVIPANIKRGIPRWCGIGEGLRSKVNAHIGMSVKSSSTEEEIRKLEAAVRMGADAVMDLSCSSNLRKNLEIMLTKSCIPVGTVPVYEAAVEAQRKYGCISKAREDDFFSTLEEQAQMGVDFFTVHAGVTRQVVSFLKSGTRILDVVSRGGAILIEWMEKNNRENPFYEGFDRVLEIAKKYDVTLSLGDGMRPGAIRDASDQPQIQELVTLGRLQKRAYEAGVQVMIEGPGHVPINQIQTNVAMEKSLCNRAPFYVLGPVVTDIAPGYDHITGAIGGALAASFGADFLCYITPSEHLRLPTVKDVEEGVVTTRIAAHAADIAKGVKGAMEQDILISKARKERNWGEQFSLAINPEKPKEFRLNSRPISEDVCSMCDEYCPLKLSRSALMK